MSTKVTVTEAPSYEQVRLLTSALDKLFGVDVEVGQSGSTLYFTKTLDDGSKEYWAATPVSGTVRKATRPGGYNALMNGANTISAMLLQNAEMQSQVIMPIIRTLQRMAGVDAPTEDFVQSDVPSSLEDRQELAQLRTENAALKAEVERLKAKIESMSGERVLTPASKYRDLEID
jgi:hypothetical protein